MHDGCGGTFTSGQGVVDKLRMMGFSQGAMPQALSLKCRNCDEPMEMDTFEFTCPSCQAVHGVTPCHAHSAESVQCAGVGY